jgi:hypothetical protein
MKYNFEILSNINKKNKYIKDNQERIVELLNKCFNMEITDDFIDFMSNNDVFICTYGDKIIGIAMGSVNKSMIRTDELLKTYDSLSYLYRQSTYVIDNRSHKEIDLDYIILQPLIMSLCKDKGHDNVGRFLMKNVEKYYKDNDYKEIYLVPESNIHKNELIDAHYKYKGDKSFKKYISNILKKYKSTQTKLIKYYENIGYKIYDNHYEGELLHDSKRIYPFCMFFNVMMKKLV